MVYFLFIGRLLPGVWLRCESEKSRVVREDLCGDLLDQFIHPLVVTCSKSFINKVKLLVTQGSICVTFQWDSRPAAAPVGASVEEYGILGPFLTVWNFSVDSGV